MGAVPSHPFVLREKWFKVHIYLDSWAVVNGFSCFVRAGKEYVWMRTRRSREETNG